MNSSIRKKFLFCVLIIFLCVVRILTKLKLTEQEYAWQVVDQFTHFTCSRNGICDRKEALAHLREKWISYAEYFSMLEDEKRVP